MSDMWELTDKRSPWDICSHVFCGVVVVVPVRRGPCGVPELGQSTVVDLNCGKNP